MRNLLILVPLVALACGCAKPEERAETTLVQDEQTETQAPSDQTETVAQTSEWPVEAERQAIAAELWDEWPDFTTELSHARTFIPLEQTLPADFGGDPADVFVKLDGILINDSNAAVLLTSIGSGMYIDVITIYLLKEEQWELSYRYKESLYGPLTVLDMKDLDLHTTDYSFGKSEELTIPLPGKVDIEKV